MAQINTQCQAQHPMNRWPYVKRCRQFATRVKVYVKPLRESLDLCEEDYMDYLGSLNLQEARALSKIHDKESLAP